MTLLSSLIRGASGNSSQQVLLLQESRLGLHHGPDLVNDSARC